MVLSILFTVNLLVFSQFLEENKSCGNCFINILVSKPESAHTFVKDDGIN